MRRKFLLTAIVFVLFCNACGIERNTAPTEEKNRTEMWAEDTESGKITDVEINIVSLVVCPEMAMVRLTYDVKVLKEMAHPNSYAGQFYTNVVELCSVKREDAGNKTYRIVETGDYTVSTEKLEKIGAENFFGFNHKGLEATSVKNDEMEITRVSMKEFEAADGNGTCVTVKLCPLGGRIESDTDWQKNERVAYVVADLENGSSEYVIRIPAVVQGKDRKKYQAEPPEEVQALEEKDVAVFQLTGMLQPDLKSLVFHFDENLDMDTIAGFRLIMQDLE